MANAANPLIPPDGQLVITDGAALTFTLPYEDGDISISGLTKGQKAVQKFTTRGRGYAVRETEDQDVEISFTAHAVGLKSDGTTALISDIVNKIGVWSGATSTLPAAAGDAFCVTCTWTGERTSYGASADAYLRLKYVHFDEDFSEGIPGKISVKGTAYVMSYLGDDSVLFAAP